MRSELLECLIALEKTGSINKASGVLLTTPQNISRMLRGLEDEMGFKIVDRLTTGIRFTAAGKELLAFSHQSLQELERIKEKYKPTVTTTQQIQGKINVALQMNSFYSEALMDFRQKYPNVKISILSIEAENISEDFLLQEDRILLYANYPHRIRKNLDIAQLKHKYTVIPIMEDEVGTVVNKKHPLSRQKTTSWEKILHLEAPLLSSSLVEKSLLNEDDFILTNASTSLLVNHGMGIGLIGYKMFQRINTFNREEVCFIPLRDDNVIRHFLILNEREASKTEVQCFYESLRDFMNEV